jgi:glyoxylase-like metal-dependent hydrolase (beta-lactamase superfamily II)
MSQNKKAKKIIDGVWWVGCGSWGGFTEILSVEGSGNVFLVGESADFALIDGGIVPGVDAVLENCRAAGAVPSNIKNIIISHPHGDHFLGAPALQKKTGASIAATDLAARAFGGDAETIDFLYVSRFKEFRHFKVNRVLNEGDNVNLGPYTFKVMLTPGHIPGSVTLVGEVAGKQLVFSGDTAIGDQGEAKGVHGWLDGHWHSNPKHLLKSFKRIIECDADIMLAGHGFPIVGRESVRESLNNCIDRVNQLLAIPNLDCMMPLDFDD